MATLQCPFKMLYSDEVHSYNKKKPEPSFEVMKEVFFSNPRPFQSSSLDLNGKCIDGNPTTETHSLLAASAPSIHGFATAEPSRGKEQVLLPESSET